jgi:hypothetical protein
LAEGDGKAEDGYAAVRVVDDSGVASLELDHFWIAGSDDEEYGGVCVVFKRSVMASDPIVSVK